MKNNSPHEDPAAKSYQSQDHIHGHGSRRYSGLSRPAVPCPDKGNAILLHNFSDWFSASPRTLLKNVMPFRHIPIKIVFFLSVEDIFS
jgi:hypothetical protein